MRAREVVNATGVWTDDVQALVGERGKFQVRASKGIHLVVPRDRMQLDTGLILRTETSRAVRDPVGPALDHRHHRHRLGARQGAPGGVARPTSTTCSSSVNAVLAQPLTHEDVEGVYAGLRPLLTGESESTSQLSREHTVAVPVPGLVAVAGGKYTTYRVMARDAVDAVARGLDRARPAVGHPRHAAARRRGLPGAVEPARAAGARRPACTSRGSSTCCAATARGSTSCSALVAERPELGEPLPGADDYLAVEVRYAARTRARCTSTTCSPAARGSRSRPGTAASRPPRPRPG